MEKTKGYSLKDATKGFKAIYSHAKGYRGRLATVLALIAVGGTIDAFFPLFMGRIIDSIAQAEYDLTLDLIFLFGGLVAARSILANVQGRISSFTDESMRLTYMHRLYERLLLMPISFHKNNRHGEVSQKISRGVSAIPTFWSEYVFDTLPQLVYIGVSFAIVAKTDSRIGWILVGAAVVYSALSLSFVQSFARLQRKVQESYNKASGIAGDAVFNVRMVKESAWEGRESARMKKAWFDDSLALRTRMFNKNRNLAIAQSAIAIVSRVGALWIALGAVISGNLTIGTFSALASYVAGFFAPLQQLFRRWRFIQNSLISMEESDDILRQPIERYEGKTMTRSQGEIEFKGVWFSYGNSAQILKDVSFSVRPGESVAFVGESGVGKSSLMDLVSVYYVPEKGDVLVDGVNTKDIDLKALRSSVAVVSQEITLFNATVMDNIRYGSDGASDERVKWAAEKAKCDFIERLPNKWQQMVGERGMKLSVGQKQRIAIARAFLRNPKILVLDEPTSALDAASEAHIVQSLDEIMKGRTTLIIAHRLSTVRKADRILVFKDGQIVESGTYQELVQKGGEFKRLRDLQTLNE